MFPETYIEMLMHGNDIDYKLIKPTKELILTAEAIDELRKKTIRLQQMELEDAILESENFLKSHFNLRKILHASNSTLNAELSKYDFKDIYQANQIYQATAKRIDPYQLPIVLLKNQDYRYGNIEEISPNCSDLKLYEIAPIIYERICLGAISTSCTGGIISHEITHSQIDNHKKITKSFYNREVIPIFIQLVHNLEKGEEGVHLEIDKIFRAIEISDSIAELNFYHQSSDTKPTDDLLNITRYLESTLKAFMLFEIYINSNNRIKNDIFATIQKIFNGEKTVEYLLDKYNITLQNSSKLLQKQYLKRR